ncbi:hypothetical protein Dimus_029635 [Dionaea muscipula]
MSIVSLAPLTARQCFQYIQLRTQSACSHHLSKGHCCSSSSFLSISSQSHVLRPHKLSVRATFEPAEEAIGVIDFEDLTEKDWSILDIDETNTKEERNRKTDRIISSGNIGNASQVLVSLGSDDFMDKLIATSPSESLLLVHESLFLLASIKEKYDHIKCWHGELIHVPQNWAPFDVIFLYFLPALSFKLDDVVAALASRCSPGARIVMSHLRGKQALEQERQRYPDVVVSDLPDQMTLEKVAAHHSFAINEFVDEPGFYLAVLELRA